MKYIKEYFFCSPKLLNNIDEIKEIEACVSNIVAKPFSNFNWGKNIRTSNCL